MGPTQELVDSIYAEKVERARMTPADEKLRAGPELFDFAVEWMKAGIRAQYPSIDDAGIKKQIKWRLEVGRTLENKT